LIAGLIFILLILSVIPILQITDLYTMTLYINAKVGFLRSKFKCMFHIIFIC
jgi:hypothetical protein